MGEIGLIGCSSRWFERSRSCRNADKNWRARSLTTVWKLAIPGRFWKLLQTNPGTNSEGAGLFRLAGFGALGPGYELFSPIHGDRSALSSDSLSNRRSRRECLWLGCKTPIKCPAPVAARCETETRDRKEKVGSTVKNFMDDWRKKRHKGTIKRKPVPVAENRLFADQGVTDPDS
jgi:hypothetical protein